METDYKDLRIIGLHAENIMRVRAVDIKPTTNIVVVGGDNEQGKTSVLEAIAMVFGGTRVMPERPLRTGAKAGIVVADLDEIIITRSLKEDGTSELEVKSKAGARFPSPQKMLEALIGRVCYDPVQFIKLDAEKQLATLKQIVKLDFTALDVRYANAYGNRTDVNKAIASLKAQAKVYPEVNENLASEPKDAVELSRQIAEAERFDNDLNDLETRGREATSLVNETAVRVTELEKELETVKQDLVDRQAALKTLREQYAAKKKSGDEINLTQLEQELADIKKTNERIQQNNRRKELDCQLAAKVRELELLEREIGDVAIEKEKKLTAAKFPIPGLSFNDTGVLYNGTPFSQASAAAQLRTSLAMGIALNPKIRVMIIRDGSLLDNQNLTLIREMAEESNVQVWIERVGNGEECTVVIEDGEIIEDRTVASKTPKPKAKTESARRPISGPRAK